MRNRWLALGILCTASLMVILDGTIVTVALPAIQQDLGFTAGNLSWVMTAYLIAFGGLLLLGGRLGDLLGRKRLFLAGIAMFVVASLACGLAVTPWMLIAARFVQGGGAAMASAVTLGMIVRLFDSPAEQSRAIGAFAFTGAVGASAGLILGGLLVQYASWHWIFFVNLPVGAATALAGWRVLSGDAGLGLRAGADGIGALLATSGVMLAVFAIASRADWWAGLIAVALLAGFAVRQATARTPLLPLRVLASRAVAGANVAQLFIIGAAMGFQVIVILYFQRALGYGAAAAGLGLFPTAVVIAMVSLGLSARLIVRFGARALLLSGLVAITGALAVLDSGAGARGLRPVAAAAARAFRHRRRASAACPDRARHGGRHRRERRCDLRGVQHDAAGGRGARRRGADRARLGAHRRRDLRAGAHRRLSPGLAGRHGARRRVHRGRGGRAAAAPQQPGRRGIGFRGLRRCSRRADRNDHHHRRAGAAGHPAMPPLTCRRHRGECGATRGAWQRRGGPWPATPLLQARDRQVRRDFPPGADGDSTLRCRPPPYGHSLYGCPYKPKSTRTAAMQGREL